MINIENKKIPVTIILISVIGSVIGYLKKDIYSYSGVEFNVNYPLKYYEIYVLGHLIDCTNFFIVMLLIFGFGIYIFFYKTDEEIKISLNNFKNRGQKIKTLLAFKNVVKTLKDFYSPGKRNKINNVEENKFEKEIEDKDYWIEKFLNYDGRINRTDFFWRTLLFSFIFYIIINKHNEDPFSVDGSVSLGLLILFNFGIKTKIKRLHDINLSGWICLLPFILEISLVISLIFKSYMSTDFCLVSKFLFVGIVPLFNILLLLIPSSKSKNKF
jgi:uncharacterized membrane protein YhaH (DUF805 family)